MSRYVFSGAPGSQYPTLNLGQCFPGGVAELVAAPDAFWTLTDPSAAITVPTLDGGPSPAAPPFNPPLDGYVLTFDGPSRTAKFKLPVAAGALPWTPFTVYKAGQIVLSPVDGSVLTAKADFTSASTFDATRWNQTPGSATFAARATTNTFTKGQTFAGVSAGQDAPYTGVAADFSGGVGDTTPNGGYYNRMSAAVTFSGGTNGARGDNVASATANSTGATFFAADFIGVEAGGFVGRGSAQGYYFRGILGDRADHAYGEFGGVLSDMTNNRPGALAEAAEFTLRANTQAKNVGVTIGLLDNVGVTGLAGYNWSRGLWINSGGGQVAGDGLYVAGSAGWTNFAQFLAPDGANRWRVDNTGKHFIGANSRTLYDNPGSGLQTDATFLAGNLYTSGDVYGNDFLFQGDGSRKLLWCTGTPLGAVSASVGSIALRLDGGAGTTLYVKESGSGTTTGWVAK